MVEVRMRISEVNPNTSKGSYGKGLNLARLWSLHALSKIQNKFDTIYVIGSWYGNISIMFALLKNYFKFNKIVNVEQDKKALQASEETITKLGIKNIEPMYADANELDYRQLGNNGLVVCFSCMNIRGTDWFYNIPDGTLVMLQARTNDLKAVTQFKNFNDFANTYRMSEILHTDKLNLSDPETDYAAWLIIGIK